MGRKLKKKREGPTRSDKRDDWSFDEIMEMHMHGIDRQLSKPYCILLSVSVSEEWSRRKRRGRLSERFKNVDCTDIDIQLPYILGPTYRMKNLI